MPVKKPIPGRGLEDYLEAHHKRYRGTAQARVIHVPPDFRCTGQTSERGRTAITGKKVWSDYLGWATVEGQRAFPVAGEAKEDSHDVFYWSKVLPHQKDALVDTAQSGGMAWLWIRHVALPLRNSLGDYLLPICPELGWVPGTFKNKGSARWAELERYRVPDPRLGWLEAVNSPGWNVYIQKGWSDYTPPSPTPRSPRTEATYHIRDLAALMAQ